MNKLIKAMKRETRNTTVEFEEDEYLVIIDNPAQPIPVVCSIEVEMTGEAHNDISRFRGSDEEFQGYDWEFESIEIGNIDLSEYDFTMKQLKAGILNTPALVDSLIETAENL